MDDAPLAMPSRPCPICGKPAAQKYRPFCSDRCSLVDLGRWLGEGYRVPTAETPDDDSAQPGRDETAEGPEDGGSE
jgi:endogenous inhibitor of DNA gyrase (YacG/DUF329 family)